MRITNNSNETRHMKVSTKSLIKYYTGRPGDKIDSDTRQIELEAGKGESKESTQFPLEISPSLENNDFYQRFGLKSQQCHTIFFFQKII